MKSNFKTMSREELRAYILEHREDEEAFQLYLDQVMGEPEEIYPASKTIDDLNNFSQLLPKNKGSSADSKYAVKLESIEYLFSN